MKRALICDDSIENIYLLTEMLRYFEIESKSCHHPDQLYEMINEFGPVEVLFLDLLIGTSTVGLTTLSNWKEKGIKFDFPIVVTSGLADYATITKALSLGAKEYVIKPYSFSALKDKLKELKIV